MKTTVVCGLLGSGKTTFIRNFLHQGVERAVVLVNDFGQAGIDGEIFSTGGIEAVELPSGCVCCTLRFDLITTIQRVVKQFAPEHLVIEPSGVASPSGVLEALESAGFGAASVIGIIDAVEFTELYESGMYGSFFEDQIRNSDVILVNKTDLAEKDLIESAERTISEINPRAMLFRTVNAMLTHPLSSREDLHPLPLGERPALSDSTELAEVLPNGAGACPRMVLSRVRGSVPAVSHFHFETLSFPINNQPSFSVFTSFFHELAQGRFGTVARAKALVHTAEGPYRFDITYGKIDSVRFVKDIGSSRLVVIGEGLDRRAMESFLPPA